MNITWVILSFQRNVLHLAAEYNHKSVLEYILNHHDDIIDSVDNESRSPLHIAASHSCADCVKVI